MKRFFLLTAILAVFGLSSCEKDPSKAIVGTWEAVSIEMSTNGINMDMDLADIGATLQFTFNADGTAELYLAKEDEREDLEFSYELDGNNLTITTEDEGFTAQVTIDKTSMTMEVDGDVLGEEGTKLRIHFTKK